MTVAATLDRKYSFGISLPGSLCLALDQRAQELGVTRSEFVAQAVRAALKSEPQKDESKEKRR